MEKMYNLPRELVEEILSRVPVKWMREVRLTCKKWNTISKHIGKAAAAREGEFLGIVLARGLEPLYRTNSVDLPQRQISSPLKQHVLYMYAHAIGYDKSKSCRAHKILWFADPIFKKSVSEIYEFNSNSWRVLDVTRDWYIAYVFGCVSLKGNIYWGVTDEELQQGGADFLICFDFTTEKFGPRLSLPFRPYGEDDVVTLSAFGEEQLAVLFQPFRSNGMEIWVTTKIEPNVVLWSKFLAFDLRPLNDGSFLIDKEKRAVVVFHEDRDVINLTRYTAYIIGENGYFREVNIGEITDNGNYLLTCSYVPSSVFF
ncbi:F-box associated domain type 1 [Arabidopsis suecica]|uniref:F-box associated domain type 1 n=1 Tax=Arabidopsis suecica TaxID=45249 RepID=A0A8T2AHU0_ARASU|nr:F-box associated domain type 1 [Arabidopsis suecica]